MGKLWAVRRNAAQGRPTFQRRKYAFGNRPQGGGAMTKGLAQGNRSQVQLEGYGWRGTAERGAF